MEKRMAVEKRSQDLIVPIQMVVGSSCVVKRPDGTIVLDGVVRQCWRDDQGREWVRVEKEQPEVP